MKIPNRMSFFWSGGPLSWMRYMAIWSFRLLNPTWDIHLYLAPAVANQTTWETGEPQDCSDGVTIQPDYFGKLAALGVKIEGWQPPPEFSKASPVHCADLCRWGVLSEFGGWFSDTDMLFVDSMDFLTVRCREQVAETAVLRQKHPDRRWTASAPTDDPDIALIVGRDSMPTGLIGAVRHNRLTPDLYVLAKAQADFRRYRSCGSEAVLRMAGQDPRFPPDWRKLQLFLASAAQPNAVWFMPQTVAYRWDGFDVHRIFGEQDDVFVDTIAIHWYGGTRVGQKFNRLWNETNFRQHRCSWTSYAAHLLDGTDGTKK